MEKIKIKSEEDATKYLEIGINEVNLENIPAISFDSWPNVELNIFGHGYDASLKTRQLKAIIKLQEAINYQYAFASNKPKNRLTEDEIRSLELNVSIKKGSSDVKINLAEIFEKIANVPTTTIIVLALVAAGLIYASHSIAKRHQDLKVREADNQSKLFDLIRELALRFPETTKITDTSYHAMENLARCADDADHVLINGVASKAPKKNRSQQDKPYSRYKKGGFYKEPCLVIGVKKPKKGDYKYEFIFSDDEGNQLVWTEKKSNISDRLVREIEAKYSSKNETYIEFDDIKRTSKNSYNVTVRSIFRKNNKPKSYK